MKEYNYSFGIDKKKSPKTLELLKTTTSTDSDGGVVLQILDTSLSANNKFYVDFGDKPPFNFFKCYPISSSKSSLVNDENKSVEDYAHPPVWGLCKVIESSLDDVAVGSHYFGQLPMAETCAFVKATVNPKDDSLVVDRPETNAAYNVFSKVEPGATFLSPEYGGLAAVCFPGIITGFGLYYNLKFKDYYGVDTVVVTSASSKVALALALYLKQEQDDAGDNKKIRVIGYTSPSNMEFCKSTGLYDEILQYGDKLDKQDDASCVLIDISGNAKPYVDNTSKLVKLLCVGNSSASPDDQSTFAHFSGMAKVKMICAMMGLPSFLHGWMNPVQELFLIMDTSATLQKEWGIPKYKATMEDFTKSFCEQASKWISVRQCNTEESLQQGYEDIMNGKVPPTEAIVLNVGKAVAHRK